MKLSRILPPNQLFLSPWQLDCSKERSHLHALPLLATSQFYCILFFSSSSSSSSSATKAKGICTAYSPTPLSHRRETLTDGSMELEFNSNTYLPFQTVLHNKIKLHVWLAVSKVEKSFYLGNKWLVKFCTWTCFAVSSLLCS